MKKITYLITALLIAGMLMMTSCPTDSDTCAHDWGAWAVTVPPSTPCEDGDHGDDGKAARACTRSGCTGTETRVICGGTEGLEIEDGVVTGIGTAGTVDHLCIPAFIEDDPVTGIGEGVFNGNGSIKSVRGGFNLTDIGDWAFDSCVNLESASFPKVITIGDWVFEGCGNLKEVSFPAATSIGEGAFCFTSLKVASFPAVTSIGDWAFADCTSLESASFPEAESIGESAFQGCGSLKSVSFPVATFIGAGAFIWCTNLVSISFPEAESIGVSAFDLCTSLAEVTLGDGVTSFGANAFPGNLETEYFKAPPDGGAGTYESDLATPPVWTKQ